MKTTSPPTPLTDAELETVSGGLIALAVVLAVGMASRYSSRGSARTATVR